MTAPGIPGDGEKTVTHSDAASGWVFTLNGEEEEMANEGIGEAAQCPSKDNRLLATEKQSLLYTVPFT